MSFTIGRFTSTEEPRSVVVNGEQVTFVVDLATTVAGDADHLRALRQQFVGLADNEDEDVVPVTWSLDPTFDGFYRVASVQSGDSQVMFLRARHLSASVTLERLRGYGNPTFEVTTQSVVRTNTHSYTTPAAVTAAGSEAVSGSEFSVGFTVAASLTRPNDQGLAAVLTRVVTAAAPVALSSFRFSAPASQFYWGACRVELLYGLTWYEVMGRDIPVSRVWRISNGIVRLTSANGATSGMIEIWDNTAAAWEPINVEHNLAGTPVAGGGIGGGNGTTQSAVTILRNSPEQVIVKVVLNVASTTTQTAFTYSIQRGAHIVVWTAATQTAVSWGLGFTASTASTASGPYLIKTTNDANLNRVIFAFPGAVASNAATGVIWPDVATSITGMIGVELHGTAASAGNTASDLLNQFMGAVAWRQRVISR